MDMRRASHERCPTGDDADDDDEAYRVHDDDDHDDDQWSAARHSRDHSDTLPKVKEEHHFFFCRFANTHLPLCSPTAYSRTLRLHSLGSWTQAFMNWLPQHSSQCPVDQWDS